jgi:putative transposase
VIDAILYLTRTGSAWRYLPKDQFPPWRSVYGYFHKWTETGFWRTLHETLVRLVRVQQKRSELPSLCIVDAQSIRSHWGEDRGYDPVKKVRGIKRNIFVDTLGLIWSCEVHSANQTDARGGLKALQSMPALARSNLQQILADQVYTWPLDYYAEIEYKIPLVRNVREKEGGGKGAGKGNGPKAKPEASNLKPLRWIVERTFAWFNHFRRLSRDYERKPSHSQSMIYLAMISIMLKRLVPSTAPS